RARRGEPVAASWWPAQAVLRSVPPEVQLARPYGERSRRSRSRRRGGAAHGSLRAPTQIPTVRSRAAAQSIPAIRPYLRTVRVCALAYFPSAVLVLSWP